MIYKLKKSNFGDYAITEETYNVIKKILPEGKIILELGSGYGTNELSKHYKMYSIEHNSDWVGKYNSTYFHCPLVKQKTPIHQKEDIPEFKEWYDIDAIIDQLPKNYDLLLIDGPNGDYRRTNFISHFHKFNKDAIWVFDDCHREYDLDTYKKCCHLRNVSYNIIDCGQKKIGIIDEINK